MAGGLPVWCITGVAGVGPSLAMVLQDVSESVSSQSNDEPREVTARVCHRACSRACPLRVGHC